MASKALRQEVHGYVEQADDKILKAIKTLVKPSLTQPQLTKEQKKTLDKRKKAHLAGTSKSYTWEEVESKIKSSKK